MTEITTAAGRAGRPIAIAILAMLFTSAFASAATYGDVEVTVKNEPRGTAFHGYAEVEFLVVNRSQASHDVRLTYPRSHPRSGSDYLRAVTRTLTVEPGKNVRVVMAYPERLHGYSIACAVAIDGRDQEEAIPIGSASSRGYSYGSSRGSAGPQLLGLYSKSVDTRFPDWVNDAQMRLRSEGKQLSVEVVRADQPVDQWSTNWLGYTRYDGVVVTADDLRTMPAEVRNAIGQYVECGGSLLILGPNAPLPGPWKLQPHPRRNCLLTTPGFGECVVIDRTDLSRDRGSDLGSALESWIGSVTPWLRVRDPSDANRVFPVVEDVGIPVRGLLALMFVFAIVIGPVNFVVLTHKKRKLWLFWTVPLISFITCLTVIAYMAVTEGWKGRSRIEGFTILDENSRRASSLGWTGFYTPLLPSGGLHFSPDTEVNYQNGEYPHSRRGSSGSALTIDWTRDQHFSSGWLTPRVPAHFALRKSELRRERMTISKGADGLEAVNGLGADLSEFWYCDETGNLFHADAILAGERANLPPAPRPTSSGGVKSLRSVYAGEWTGLSTKMKVEGPALLAPRTYLGVMEAAPFMDDGMPGASVRKMRSIVYGILKEGGDGG